MKKKIKTCILTLLTVILLLPLNIYANEGTVNENASEPNTEIEIEKVEKMVEEMFCDFNEDDKVLPLDDGGFLVGSGEAKVFDFNNPKKVLMTYNVDTDPKSITVQAAKQNIIQRAENTSVQPLQNIVIPSSDSILGLSYGMSYVSCYFSAKGWRVSGSWYIGLQPEAYGTALRYSTYNDSGRVTNPNEIYLLANGGYPICPGQFYWIDAHGMPTTYMTHDPQPYTYFVVSNRDDQYVPNIGHCQVG